MMKRQASWIQINGWTASIWVRTEPRWKMAFSLWMGIPICSMRDGYRRMGLVIVSMKTYYLDDKGILQTGFRVLDGVTHYFDPEDGGAMAVSKGLLIKGSYYLFDADGYIYARALESSEEAKGVQIVMYAQQFIGNLMRKAATSLTEGADRLRLYPIGDGEIRHPASQKREGAGGIQETKARKYPWRI